jgi:phage terminase small subunit
MQRGAKPKPQHLKVVDGTFRPDRESTVEGDAVPLPPRPKYLKGRAAKIWDEMAERMPELTEFQIAVLESFCSLKSEYERSPDAMPTSRIVEMRRQAELLLAPRGLPAEKANAKPKDPAEKYF